MKNSSSKTVFLLAISFAFMVLCLGCASVPEPAPPPPVPAEKEAAETYFTHVVKWPGESLSIIAGWYTGDIQNWKTLAEVNTDINPNRIHEGMKLRIPESMMKTKAAMTKDYVDSYYPKAKKQPTKSSSAPAKDKEKDDEPVLYGPKQYPVK